MRGPTAPSSASARRTESIEASSTISMSRPGIGSSGPREKPSPGTYSSSRWIVLASAPVSSPSRRAALPVGAHSRTLRFCVAQQVDERAHRLRLARPRQAGEDRQPVLERVRHRLPLGVGRDEGAAQPGARSCRPRAGAAPAATRPARGRCAPGAARSRTSPGPRRARPPRRASRRRRARRGGPRRRPRAAATRGRGAPRAAGGSGRRPRPGGARGAARRRCATARRAACRARGPARRPWRSRSPRPRSSRTGRSAASRSRRGRARGRCAPRRRPGRRGPRGTAAPPAARPAPPTSAPPAPIFALADPRDLAQRAVRVAVDGVEDALDAVAVDEPGGAADARRA